MVRCNLTTNIEISGRSERGRYGKPLHGRGMVYILAHCPSSLIYSTSSAVSARNTLNHLVFTWRITASNRHCLVFCPLSSTAPLVANILFREILSSKPSCYSVSPCAIPLVCQPGTGRTPWIQIPILSLLLSYSVRGTSSLQTKLSQFKGENMNIYQPITVPIVYKEYFLLFEFIDMCVSRLSGSWEGLRTSVNV